MFLFADGNWPWTQELCRGLATTDAVGYFLLRDWRNALRAGWTWGSGLDSGWVQADGRQLWTRRVELPPGWASSLRCISMRAIARFAHAAPFTWDTIVVTYSFYLPFIGLLSGRRVVYYCLDDYRLYWPSRADRIGREEYELVHRADLTVCISTYRATCLKSQVPSAAGRIVHLPLGVSEECFPTDGSSEPRPAPERWRHLRRPLVGYVGTLTDRVDWKLVYDVAASMPNWSFVFIGDFPVSRKASAGGRRPEWYHDLGKVQSLKNSLFPGRVRQDEVGSINQCFDVCWIPYAVDHEFNVNSCPTKIMDFLASGRPIVSTPVPECQLYRGVMRLASSPQECREELRCALGEGHQAQLERIRFAKDHSWAKIAGRFEQLLPRV